MTSIPASATPSSNGVQPAPPPAAALAPLTHLDDVDPEHPRGVIGIDRPPSA